MKCIDVAVKTASNKEHLQDILTFALVKFVKYGNEYAVEKLITSGADVNYVDDSGKTPLNYADEADVKEILLRHGGKYGDPDLIFLCSLPMACTDFEEEQKCIEKIQNFENLECAMKKYKQEFQRSFVSNYIATHNISIVDYLVNAVSDVSVISYSSIFENLFSTWRLFSGCQYNSKVSFREDVKLRFSVAKNLVSKECKVEISPLKNYCQLKEKQQELFEDNRELFAQIIDFFCEQNCDINELDAGCSLSYWALVSWNLSCLSTLVKFKPKIICKENSSPSIDMLKPMLSDDGIGRMLDDKIYSYIDCDSYSEAQKQLINKLHDQYEKNEEQKMLKCKNYWI